MPIPHLSKSRTLLLGAGTVGLAAVALLGGGIASAAGGTGGPPGGSGGPQGGPPPGSSSSSSGSTSGQPQTAPSGAPAARPSGAPAGGQGGMPPQGGPGGGGPGGGPGGGLVHGRVVRQSGTTTKTYTTEDLQRGVVTAVSTTSLTVKSSDDFTETYVLTDSTTYGRDGKASDIAVGDSVSVVATVADDTATATHVDEPKAPPAKPTSSAAPSPSSTS